MILNGNVFNPGEMNTRITLKTRAMVQDPGGAQKPAYTVIAAVWAKWVNGHGPELETAGGQQVERLATVTIRYCSALDETCVVFKGAEIFEISSIDDIRERHEYMELKCRRVKAG